MASSSSKRRAIVDVIMAKRMWNKFEYERTQDLYTPFVICLACGTLENEAFLHYIEQDVHIIRTFEKVLSLDLSKETTPHAATVKYTDFLLATASGKVEGITAPGKIGGTPLEKTKLAPYILRAMTPRMSLHAFLGKEVQTIPRDPIKGPHQYQTWIDNFSSKTFQEEAKQTEDLLGKLSVTLTGDELGIVEKVYHQAMKLKVEFLLSQPLVQKCDLPMCKGCDRLTLYSAFDLTCTVLDSADVLAELAIVTSPNSAHTRSMWEEISKKYTDEYEQCVDIMLVGNKAEKYDYQGLRKAIQHISDFEKGVNLRVISGVLKGLKMEDIKRAGERMRLQDGCMDFLHSAINNKNLDTKIHVISYCWCGDLIRSTFSAGGIDCVNVHTNELIYENSISTGEIDKKIESPKDKSQAFDRKCNNRFKDGLNLTVYIGDTVGDLLCLIDAAVGIVIGSSSSLRRLGSHFGVTFVPLFPLLV